ncbi:gamma-glutamylcyclotransferase family protein [Roseomonas acroporae]|uniref:gamma-glutamylcyclotransferase family protein n=1 Tax=Roseomonas acroporae TaxID=2937791 RepID=UPI0031F5B533
MPAVFLYGTLLDPAVLARRSGDPSLARRARPAVLHGWRRVILRGTPYPTLLPAPGAEVTGLLIRPGAAAMARLRDYEGPSYRLVPVRVATARGPRNALAWCAARWRAGAAAWG